MSNIHLPVDLMSPLGRARYNLLQRKILEDPSLHVEPWEIANYREWETNDLFDELASFGIEISPRAFEKMAEQFESPEELFENISEEGGEESEQVYLILFELWRRILNHFETISIFCDELDHQIDLFQKDPQNNEELLQTLFFELGDIIDDNVDAGQKPKVVLNHIKAHLASDLEKTLYHFIENQLQRGNSTMASELISHFSEYFSDNLLFDFLKIKQLEGVPEDHATSMISRFLEKLREKPDIDTYYAFLRHLVQIGDSDLFKNTSVELLALIKTEWQLQEFLKILLKFLTLNDLDKEEKFIREIIQKRKDIAPQAKLSSEDKKILQKIIS